MKEKFLYIFSGFAFVSLCCCSSTGGGKCWSSYNVDDEVYAVGGCPGGPVYAVGDGVYIRNGESWDIDGYSSAHIWDIYCVSADNLLTVNSDGEINRNTGNGWSTLHEVSDAELRGIWGSADDDIYVVGVRGDVGVIQHYDGNEWIEVLTESGTKFNAVWGSSKSDLFALGVKHDAGIIRKYDGNNWDEVTNISVDSLNAIWGTSNRIVYAVGSSVLQYNGTTWEDIGLASDGWMRSVHGIDENNVFIAGDDGQVYQFDGIGWNEISLEDGNDIYDIWVDSRGSVLTVGSGWDDITRIGKIYKYICD